MTEQKEAKPKKEKKTESPKGTLKVQAEEAKPAEAVAPVEVVASQSPEVPEEIPAETPPEIVEEVSAKPISDEWKDQFHVGDKVSVRYKIKEGDSFRIQPFEGIVISRRGSGMSKTFIVRRMATGGIGVERIFPLHSPNIEQVVVKARGKVRRAKLYYLRKRIGKSATKIKSFEKSL